MRVAYRKLFISATVALIAITLMVVASYAWFTMSDSPSVSGMQITIGGTNTIQVAADCIEKTDSGEIHYPGKFGDTLQVSLYEEYNYLQTLSGLLPVSTADGRNWFYLPQQKNAVEEQNITVDDYLCDDTLQFANGQRDGKEGYYAYMDFWVVSPMDHCSLRLSVGSPTAGVREEGSYVITLPTPEKTTDADSPYRLSEDGGQAAASARVGFLVNTDAVTDNQVMETYVASGHYNDHYRSLRGDYTIQQSQENDHYRFTIYEPNADSHPGDGVSFVASETGLTYTQCEDGQYVVTRPIGKVNGNNVLVDVSDRLAVQLTNSYHQSAAGGTMLEQSFRSAMVNKDLPEEELASYFYGTCLRGQYSAYVNRAPFLSNARELFFRNVRGVVSAETIAELDQGETAENAVIVTLERNVPQKIRMFVWMEGQDVDCMCEAASQLFAVGIELAGSTQN